MAYKDIYTINTYDRGQNYVKDIEAINQSIKNILQTPKGSILWDRDFGSRLNSVIFDSMDETTINVIENHITISLGKFEPRIITTQILVEADYSNHLYKVKIIYKILESDEFGIFEERLDASS